MLLQWAVLLGPGGQAVSIHVYIHIHISIYLHIFAYLYTYMHIYLYTYTYLCIYTYMSIFIYLYMYIYISLFTYLYTSYIKTCIHIYIYTFVPTCSSMVLPGGQGGAADPQERAQGGAADPLAATQCRPGPYSGSDGTRGNRRKQSKAASPETLSIFGGVLPAQVESGSELVKACSVPKSLRRLYFGWRPNLRLVDRPLYQET